MLDLSQNCSSEAISSALPFKTEENMALENGKCDKTPIFSM